MKYGWLGATAVILAAGTGPYAAPVGSKAPPVEPSEWINHEGPAPSWSKLQGRLILVEKWATW